MTGPIMLVLFCLCIGVSFYFLIKALFLKMNFSGSNTLRNIKPERKQLFLAFFLFLTVFFILNFIFALLSAVIFFYIKWLINEKRKKDKIKKINGQITEMIKIFKNNIMAGQSVNQTIYEVSRQIHEPLSAEFKKIHESVSFGLSLDDALNQSSKNIESGQYKLFIDSIRIANITGAKLSDMLGKIEQSVVKQIEIYSKVETLTAQGKISGLIVSVVPFFIILFVYIMEPDIMGILFTTFLGNIIFFIAVVMLLLGSFFMKKITEIDI